MSNSVKLCPTHFSRWGEENFWRASTPGYGPAFKWRFYPTFRRSTPPAQV